MTVVIESESPEEMQTMTNAVNTTNGQAALGTMYNTEVGVTEQPKSVVQTVDQAFGAVNTVLSGFSVESIMYNDTAFEWVLRAQYVDNSPNTITSLYLSKAGLPPYARTVQDTFFVSQHPCMQDSSVCCLLEYSRDYVIGKFADNITDSIGICDAGVRQEMSKNLFGTNANPYLVEHMLDGYPNSYVKRLSPTAVD
eukprot:3715557-Rhodomonas_salina.1